MPLDRTQWASDPRSGMFATPRYRIVQLRIAEIIWQLAYVCVKIVPTNPVWKTCYVVLRVNRKWQTSIMLLSVNVKNWKKISLLMGVVALLCMVKSKWIDHHPSHAWFYAIVTAGQLILSLRVAITCSLRNA
jgi:hypothetical protein